MATMLFGLPSPPSTSTSTSLASPSSSVSLLATFPSSPQFHLHSLFFGCFSSKFQRAWIPHKHHTKLLLRKAGMASSYMEQPKNGVLAFLSKLQGGLPVLGLLSRLLSDEGGIGGDRIHFVEFCRKVEKACSPEASRAFFQFEELHGTGARPQYVLIWCWAAAVGAGLLKSEEIMLGAARLRVSYDIQFEIESLNYLMDISAKEREKSRLPAPDLPMIARAEKALDAICKCCIEPNPITEEDIESLSTILTAVFPAVNKLEILQVLRSRSRDTSKHLVEGESINKKDKQEIVQGSSTSVIQ